MRERMHVYSNSSSGGGTGGGGLVNVHDNHVMGHYSYLVKSKTSYKFQDGMKGLHEINKITK